MKHISLRKIISLLIVSTTLTTLSFADDTANPAPDSGTFLTVEDAKVSTDWLTKAKQDYPLDTCTVSGEKLEGGDMDKPQDLVYREAGKPDRLVRMCCPHCVRDLKKDPAKYLKMIDDAAATKAKPAPLK